MSYKFKNNYFFISILLLLFACEEKVEVVEEEMMDEQDKVAAFMFTKVEKWYSEDANLKIKMRAPLELIYQKGNVISEIVFPNGIKVSMYDEYGIRTTTLVADSGKHIVSTETFSAMGNVEVVNYAQKQRVNTSILNWNKRTKEIYTDKKIKITTPYETLEGIGMTSNEQFSKYKVWKPTGTFLVREGEQAIPSDTSAVARQKRSALNLSQNRNNTGKTNKNTFNFDPRLRKQFKNQQNKSKNGSKGGSNIFSGGNFNNLDSLRKLRSERLKKFKQYDRKKKTKKE